MMEPWVPDAEDQEENQQWYPGVILVPQAEAEQDAKYRLRHQPATFSEQRVADVPAIELPDGEQIQ